MHSNLLKFFYFLVLGSSLVISDSIQEQLDSIILIDESGQSQMQQRAVLGCDNTLKIAEVKCSKKRDTNGTTTAEVKNLPKSDSKDNSKDVEMEKIKSQLSDILKQLAELQKVKENNKELREQLKKVTLIQKLVEKDNISTKRAKEIKVIQVNKDHVIVKVQEGESLSKYAQKYYGNSKKYLNILRANPKKIDKTLQIYIDDELIIPTSIAYKYKKKKTTPVEKIEEPIIVVDEGKDIFEKEIVEGIIPLDEDKYIFDRGIIDGGVIPLDDNEKNVVEEVIYVEEDSVLIKAKVEKEDDIFKLATKYYGDEKQYYRIYNANKNIIGSDLKLEEGMELVIPTIK